MEFTYDKEKRDFDCYAWMGTNILLVLCGWIHMSHSDPNQTFWSSVALAVIGIEVVAITLRHIIGGWEWRRPNKQDRLALIGIALASPIFMFLAIGADALSRALLINLWVGPTLSSLGLVYLPHFGFRISAGRSDEQES